MPRRERTVNETLDMIRAERDMLAMQLTRLAKLAKEAANFLEEELKEGYQKPDVVRSRSALWGRYAVRMETVRELRKVLASTRAQG
jgi:hypothetical protein